MTHPSTATAVIGPSSRSRVKISTIPWCMWSEPQQGHRRLSSGAMVTGSRILHNPSVAGKVLTRRPVDRRGVVIDEAQASGAPQPDRAFDDLVGDFVFEPAPETDFFRDC